MSCVLPDEGGMATMGQLPRNLPVPPEDVEVLVVGQGGVSYPESPVGQAVLPHRRQPVGQATPSSTPAGAGGTPAEPGKRTRMTKAGASKRGIGRQAGGLACIGCRHYQAQRNAAGAFTGKARCLERDRSVTAAYRGACGLYEFYVPK